MAVLRLDGVDDKLKWTTLTSALQQVSVGPATCAFLIKPVALETGSTFDAFGYLLSGAGTGTVRFGLSANSGDNLLGDYGTSTASAIAVQDGVSQMVVLRKPIAADLDIIYSLYSFLVGTWAHSPTISGIGLADVAATMLEVGAWQGSDPYDGYMGLASFWDGSMSQAQVEELSANWRTSDWWNNSFGQPEFLAQMNVAGASVTDMAGNASNLTVTGTTLDAGETLDGFNFDGTGGGTPKASTDSGAGTDAFSVLFSIPSSVDTGAGSDLHTLVSTLAQVEAGAGTDPVALAALESITDLGASADLVALSAVEASTDLGTGTDTPTPVAVPAITDSGAGSDAASFSSAFSLLDSGVGSEAHSLVAALSALDSGAGTEALALLVSILSVDTGAGTETLNLDAGAGITFKSLSDAGAGVDVQALIAAVPTSENGTGTETHSLSALIANVDAGSGADASSFQAFYVVPDSGTGSDALSSLAAALLASDVGIASEAFLLSVIASVLESGAAVDIFSVFTGDVVFGARVEVTEGGLTITELSPSVTVTEIHGEVS